MMGGALIPGGDVDDLDDGDNGSLNMRAVFLDTAADAAAAAVVAVAGGVILAAGGLFWIDPAVAFVIALVVAITQFGCSLSLLQPGANPLRRP